MAFKCELVVSSIPITFCRRWAIHDQFANFLPRNRFHFRRPVERHTQELPYPMFRTKSLG